jgi:hypothetical protein
LIQAHSDPLCASRKTKQPLTRQSLVNGFFVFLLAQSGSECAWIKAAEYNRAAEAT